MASSSSSRRLCWLFRGGSVLVVFAGILYGYKCGAYRDLAFRVPRSWFLCGAAACNKTFESRVPILRRLSRQKVCGHFLQVWPFGGSGFQAPEIAAPDEKPGPCKTEEAEK